MTINTIIMDGNYAVTAGDSHDLIKTIPDHSVDLIFTDPPYNVAGYSTGDMKFKWRKTINNDIAEWDTVPFCPQHWKDEFLRVLKPTGNLMCFTAHNLIGEWHRVYDPIFDTFTYFAWHKTNPTPKFRKAGFLNSVELIVCAWNKKHTWNFGKQNEMHNFFESPICMGHERVKDPHHATQKPVRLLKHLIRIATNPGDLILDPFMGVGSTGCAAVELGRRFIGFELEDRYVECARARLARSAQMFADTAKPVFALDETNSVS